MSKPNNTGLIRIYNATFYSMKGFRAAFKHEAAIRQEFFLAILLNIAAFFISSTLAELLLLFCLPWFTFTIELINSAIEATVDRISDEYHELAGRAKDIGSASVFVFLCVTAISYLAVLGKYLGFWY